MQITAEDNQTISQECAILLSRFCPLFRIRFGMAGNITKDGVFFCGICVAFPQGEGPTLTQGTDEPFVPKKLNFQLKLKTDTKFGNDNLE